MNSRMFLGRRIRLLQRHSGSLARGWDQDRESVVLLGEGNNLIPENLRPEQHRAIDVIGTENDGSKTYHDAGLTW